MATTRSASVAFDQQIFQNYPGGGMTQQGNLTPFGAVGFNDPSLELGSVREVTAIYQMYGNEVANDVINLYLAQPGSMVSPVGSVSGAATAATTMHLTVGDDDTTGTGVVTGLNQNAATRYCADLDAHGGTNPVAFAGGASLIDPYVIGTLALEQGPLGSGTGTGMAGSWVQAVFTTLTVPVAGKVLVFRLKVIKP